MSMNREEFLEEGKLATEMVTLKSGKTVIVSEIGGADYIKLWSDPANQKESGKILIAEDGTEKPELVVDMSRFTPSLLAYSLVNDNGERLFTDEDIPTLSRLANVPFLKVSEVARKINGLAGEEAKNSKAIPPEDNSGESQLVLDIDTPTI